MACVRGGALRKAAAWCLLLVAAVARAPATATPVPEGDGAAQRDAGGIYFPLRSVELKLWVDGKSGKLLPPPGGVLFTPVLLDDSGQLVAAGLATFRLTSPASPGQTPKLPWLSVDAKTGTLKVTEERVLSDAGARRQHVVWLDARVPGLPAAPAHRSARPFMVPADRARTNVTITFEVVQEDRPCVNKPQGAGAAREDPCHYCLDSCFWLAAELQVWENKPAALLAAIGHDLADVRCGDKHQYSLRNGTEHFEVRQGALWSLPSLDRDVVYNASAGARGPGPHVPLLVECSTSWGTKEQRVVSVHVLDEDDNAPVLEKDEKLEFNFSTEAQLARGAHILVKDMDSRAANRFSELQVSDGSGVVTHKKLEFDVTHGGVQHTLISLRLQVRDPMEAHYNVCLTLTDLTLLDTKAGRDLRMNATLWGPPLTPPVAMSSSATGKDKDKDNDAAKDRGGPQGGQGARRRRSAAEEGHPLYLSLRANASRFARLLVLPEVAGIGGGKRYRLAPASWRAVNVTEQGGILFVDDPEALVEDGFGEAHNLLVHELEDDGVSVKSKWTVTVRILAAANRSSSECAAQAKQTCAVHDNHKDCTGSCGLGAEAGRCVWRDLPATNNVVTKKYATCSPQLQTCPDSTCDPLEQLDPLICPQDCTGKVLGGNFCESIRHNASVNRGLCGCVAVGTCDEDKCSCFSFKSGRQRQKGQRGRKGNGKGHIRTSFNNLTGSAPETPGLATPPMPHDDPCGSSCQAVIMAAILVSILCVSLYACWLRRSRAKRASQADRLESEYHPRRAQAGQGAAEVLRPDRSSATTFPARRASNVDPRWEVPRCQLQLHEEIGSGEFGRVLRGTLTTEEHGAATVAVKTLRGSASGPELHDLLSELELLKDVEHPNVIRLLGACTDPQGPVYVLLEYCSQGSLRGYLHRSRWTSDPDAAAAAAAAEETAAKQGDDLDQRPTMTPRTIISFAWQIAKGMDYLGQLKLVHRDLASRNILLNDGLACKISDFGLSRDVYVDEAYCKLSAGKVPVKWMAPESLLMRVYTSKSDVWSFGVLLWELCTLGGAPYSGVAPHDMVALLAAGQRLARPEHCSRELYRVMQGCWQSEAQERPHFSQLVTILDGMLARGSGYLDLDARLVLNPEYFDEQPQLQPGCTPCGEGYLLPHCVAQRDLARYENTAVT